MHLNLTNLFDDADVYFTSVQIDTPKELIQRSNWIFRTHPPGELDAVKDSEKLNIWAAQVTQKHSVSKGIYGNSS